MKETLENLKEFEIIVPAKDIFESIAKSAKASKIQDLTPTRMKEMRLVQGFLNSYIRAFSTKAGYFKLVGIKDKVKSVKYQAKRLTK